MSTNGVLHQAEPTVNGHADDRGRTVIIVGAGPVGLFLALKLGKAGMDVTVVEKEPSTSDAPRACGHYAAATLALIDAGVYDQIRDEGFMTRGLTWRKRPVDDASGGKRLGDIVAAVYMCEPGETNIQPPSGVLCLRQSLLTKLFLREALATGHVKVFFNCAISGIQDQGDSVTATCEDPQTGATRQFTAAFLVGADGGHSRTRKLLGIPFVGHTWPERLLATDVTITNTDVQDCTCHYVFDRINYTVVAALEEAVNGQQSLWRYTIAIDPEDKRTDEEIMSDDNVARLYEKVMSGPRPLKYKIERRAIYRIHQRCATTMRRGRCLLAGDAAHLNNPYGAMGLNSGILDVDALAPALTMILDESKPLSILDIYSDERRKIWQSFVDPTTTNNKLRVQCNEQDDAARDDWYFRALQNPSKENMMELGEPYFSQWRTDFRALVKKANL